MKKEYLKIEDAAELLDELVTDIKKWAEEQNKPLLMCNGTTIEGSSVIKINDIADSVNISIKIIKNGQKKIINRY